MRRLCEEAEPPATAVCVASQHVIDSWIQDFPPQHQLVASPLTTSGKNDSGGSGLAVSILCAEVFQSGNMCPDFPRVLLSKGHDVCENVSAQWLARGKGLQRLSLRGKL